LVKRFNAEVERRVEQGPWTAPLFYRSGETQQWVGPAKLNPIGLSDEELRALPPLADLDLRDDGTFQMLVTGVFSDLGNLKGEWALSGERVTLRVTHQMVVMTNEAKVWTELEEAVLILLQRDGEDLLWTARWFLDEFPVILSKEPASQEGTPK